MEIRNTLLDAGGDDGIGTREPGTRGKERAVANNRDLKIQELGHLGRRDGDVPCVHDHQLLGWPWRLEKDDCLLLGGFDRDGDATTAILANRL